MKKIVYAIALGTILTAAACSGGGAYSEKEKDTQDVADSVRQSSGFDALENAESADSNTAGVDSAGNKQ